MSAGEDQPAERTVTVPPSPFDPLAEQTSLIDGVLKFTEYRVTVLCFTSPGDGPRSADVHVKTAEDGAYHESLGRIAPTNSIVPRFLFFPDARSARASGQSALR